MRYLLELKTNRLLGCRLFVIRTSATLFSYDLLDHVSVAFGTWSPGVSLLQPEKWNMTMLIMLLEYTQCHRACATTRYVSTALIESHQLEAVMPAPRNFVQPFFLHLHFKGTCTYIIAFNYSVEDNASAILARVSTATVTVGMLPTGLSPLLHKGLFLTALQGMVFEKLFLLDSTLRLPCLLSKHLFRNRCATRFTSNEWGGLKNHLFGQC